MSEILFHYQEIYPTTWVYVSSLMIIALFFKFNRFWSVRNLDLILVILLAPGILFVHFGNIAKNRALQIAASQLTEEVPLGEGEIQTPAMGSDDQARSELESKENGADQILTLRAEAQNRAPGTNSAPRTDDTSRQQQAVAASPPAREMRRLGIGIEGLGYVWIFAVGAAVLVRLLIDTAMVRRPLLDPNLTLGGMSFVCCSLFVFLMANVITGEPTEDDLKGPRGAEQLMARQEAKEGDDSLARHGPGLPLLHVLPAITTAWVKPENDLRVGEDRQLRYALTAKLMAILSHLAVAIGIVIIGYRHFENIRSGMGAAVLYLIVPYTALMTGRVDHVLPAALLVWAIVCYRRPEIAGIFLGLAVGVIYYPFFLLPLWISFYWCRGLVRLLIGVVVSLSIMVLSLVFTSSDVANFFEQFTVMFGLWIPQLDGLEELDGLEGFWTRLDRAYRVYRITVLAAFVGISAAMALWPAQKNMGTLLSCSATVMLAAQFWHGHGGGIYMAWYLPLLLLTIFRPNLEDRVAMAVLGETWLDRRPAYPKS